MEQPIPTLPRMTIAEYLDFEEHADERHEYYDGEVVSMAGTAAAHSIIVSNLNGLCWSKLKGKPCRIYDSNLKCYINSHRRYFYPDAQIVCGPLENSPHDQTRPRSVVNPTVVIEVTSESTGEFDRGGKLTSYQQLPSLREYVLIAQGEPSVQVLERRPDGTWTLRSYLGLDAMAKLDSVGIELPLRDLYEAVDFDNPDQIRSSD